MSFINMVSDHKNGTSKKDQQEEELEDEEFNIDEKKKAQFSKSDKKRILNYLKKSNFRISSKYLNIMLNDDKNEDLAEQFEIIFAKYKHRPIKFSMFRNMVSQWDRHTF